VPESTAKESSPEKETETGRPTENKEPSEEPGTVKETKVAEEPSEKTPAQEEKETVDIKAAISAGLSYAKKLGFTVDKSMNRNNSSYFPADRVPLKTTEEAIRITKENVLGTYTDVVWAAGSIEGCRINIEIEIRDGGTYWIWIFWG